MGMFDVWNCRVLNRKEFVLARVPALESFCRSLLSSLTAVEESTKEQNVTESSGNEEEEEEEEEVREDANAPLVVGQDIALLQGFLVDVVSKQERWTEAAQVSGSLLLLLLLLLLFYLILLLLLLLLFYLILLLLLLLLLLLICWHFVFF